MDEFANVEEELIFTVVAVPLDAAKAAGTYVDGIDILEPFKLLMQGELKLLL